MTSLAKKAKLAVIWNAGFNIFRDLQQFVVMVVLVRLIEPAAYGQFNLVTTIIGFISILACNNFFAYTLQVRKDSELHYQILFTAAAGLQLFLFLFTNALAIGFHWIPVYSEVAPLLHVMSLTFLLSLPCDFRIKMLERALDWQRLRTLHIFGLVITSSIAIVMAFFGMGVYALLVPGILVTLPFTYDLFVNMEWRPNWDFSWQKYKPAWQFGLARACSGVAVSGRQLLEASVLASAIGFARLGFVNRAFGLAQMFCTRIATQLLYSIYPVITRIEPGTPSFCHMSSLVLRIVVWSALPLVLLLSILAEPTVNTIYGSTWSEVISLLPWGMAFGLGAAMTNTGYMMILACKKQQWCLWLDVMTLAGTACSLLWLLPVGLVPYLVGIVCMNGLLFIITCILLLRIGSIAWNGIQSACWPPTGSSILAICICESLFWLFGNEKNSTGTAILYGMVFVTTYTLGLRILFPLQLKELLIYSPQGQKLKRILGYADESSAR